MSHIQKLLSEINSSLINYFGTPEKSGKPKNLMDVIIATILSQNTNDKLSLQAFRNLKQNYHDWNDLLESPIAKIERLIKIGGLAKQKSRWIKDFLISISNQNKSLTLEHLRKKKNNDIILELIKYKGIGIKTIACFLLFGLRRNVFPVDTHIHRILNRIGAVSTSNPEKTFYELKDSFSGIDTYNLHINFIRLGRSICKAGNPLCFECPIKIHCKFQEKRVNLKIFSSKDKPDKKEYFILKSI